MKKCLATMLTILMLAAMPFTAHATSETPFDEASFQCNVTFFITDETAEGYPGSSFTAVMIDTTKTVTDSYSFTRGGSWGGGNKPIYTVIAPTTYTVTFEGLEDGYTIVNTLDYSSEITFQAASGGIADCYWSIIDASTGGTSDNNTKSGSELLEQAESGSYEASNEEAEEAYQTFISSVSHIADDDEWYSALLIQYEMFESRYAGWYVEYVEGGTKEEFLEMSLFDRFVWAETYLRYAWAVNTGEVSTYFGSEKNFESHVTSNITNMIANASDYQTVEDAYLTLAKWQYDYVQEMGVPYNFIGGRSYLEEVGKVTENETETSTKTDEEELSEAASELLADADETTKEEVKERSIWGDTLEILSHNFLTIAIIIILCIVMAFVVWKRKNLNIDDDTQ